MVQPQIVLCVPGRWKSVAELNAALAEHGHLLAGETLAQIDGPTYSCELQLEADERMVKSFRIATSRVRPSLSDDDLAAIGAHASVLYVLSGQYGPDEAAQTAHRMMRLARMLVNVGGLAVKCESSGLAHSATHYGLLTAEADQSIAALKQTTDETMALATRYKFWMALREAFVFPLIKSKGDVYTLGMHLLGHADVTVATGDIGDENATWELLRTVCDYTLAECSHGQPRDGEGFRAAEDAPRFVVRREPCRRYPDDDFFFNPYGYIRLEPRERSNAS